MEGGKLKDHQLESKLKDHARAVTVRRSLFERRIGRSMEKLPVEVSMRLIAQEGVWIMIDVLIHGIVIN